MSPRLHMSGIRKSFGATAALDGVDLEIFAGECHALIGENGAGKSTLMKVLSGAVQADAGAMHVDGVAYRPRGPHDARRAGVAMVYQELAVAPHLTASENILLGREPHVGPLLRVGEGRKLSLAALALVDHADVPLDVELRRLTPAQRQIVEIARAVASGCRVLVLDEPTSSLDAADVQRVHAAIRRLTGDGAAVVYISHFLDEARACCERYTVLRDGRTVAAGVVAEATNEQWIAAMVGRDVREMYPRSVRAAGEPLLEIRGLSGMRRPSDASLTLHRGEVVGVAGLIGAGRTELLRAVFGLRPVLRGTVSIASHRGPLSPSRAWRVGAGFVSEERRGEGVAERLSVAENLTLARQPAFLSAGWLASAARAWIDRLGVRCTSPAQRIAELSGGNQQKVALARLLHAQADVWLLDEPTRGIDVGAKASIYRWIDAIAAGGKDRRQGAVLLVSSYLPELLGVCDRIAVMSHGRLGEARPASEWDEHSILREATAPPRAEPAPA